MKKTLILATVAGVLAWILTIVVLNIGSFGPIPFALWPIFAAWATFFMVGANGVGARRGYLQMACGILLSLILMSGYVALKLNDPLFIWLGLLVFFLAWGLIAISGLHPELSVSAAGFVGAAIFFGMMAGNPTLSLVQVTIGSLIPAAVGFFMGLLTIWLNAKVQPKPKPSAQPQGGKPAAAA